MPKIDSLQKAINLINMRTTTVETKIKTLESKSAEASESLQFIGKENDDQKKQLDQ
jgi:prefoldin subunit 5